MPKPFAVLRPVLCERMPEKKKREEYVGVNVEETLGFGVFALRDLKVGKEIVLGWEWDDGNGAYLTCASTDSTYVSVSFYYYYYYS